MENNLSLLTPWNLFDDLFYNPQKSVSRLSRASSHKTDILKTDLGYEFHLEVPGYTKDDIEIDVTGKRLTVNLKEPKPTEHRKYLIKERILGNSSRSWDMSEPIDDSSIVARLENGILIIEMKTFSTKKTILIN